MGYKTWKFTRNFKTQRKWQNVKIARNSSTSLTNENLVFINKNSKMRNRVIFNAFPFRRHRIRNRRLVLMDRRDSSLLITSPSASCLWLDSSQYHLVLELRTIKKTGSTVLSCRFQFTTSTTLRKNLSFQGTIEIEISLLLKKFKKHRFHWALAEHYSRKTQKNWEFQTRSSKFGQFRKRNSSIVFS